MNFTHLNYVMEIAKQGSISRAAKELYITQPYLSRILKEVESDLQITLFVRSPKGIILTPEGHEFIERAGAILKEFKELQDNLIVAPKSNDNQLTITSVRSSIVMEAFLEMAREYEKVNEYTFTYKEAGGIEPLNDIIYHRSDLAVIFSPNPSVDNSIMKKVPEQVVYEKICDLQFCFILGINHPLLQSDEEITFEILLEYPIVMYEEDSLPFQPTRNEKILTNLLKVSQHPKKVLVNSRAAFNNVLFQTNCFAIGNQAAVDQEDIFNIASIPFEAPKGLKPFQMGVLYRKEDRYNHLLQEFTQKLRDRYSK